MAEFEVTHVVVVGIGAERRAVRIRGPEFEEIGAEQILDRMTDGEYFYIIAGRTRAYLHASRLRETGRRFIQTIPDGCLDEYLLRLDDSLNVKTQVSLAPR